MIGDIVVLEEHHKKAAAEIVAAIIEEINAVSGRYIIAVAGESGSGKSETGRAIVDELERHGISAILLGQDDYFVLPPKPNDLKRREDAEWLGPHVEVRMSLLDNNLKDAADGKAVITKPLIDYAKNTVGEETVELVGVKAVIAEGTYTSLLKHLNTRVFIQRNRLDTLEHRQKRNRGNEVNDPFIEQILVTEHKIIAGHRFLADYIITKDFKVVPAKEYCDDAQK